MSFTGFAEYAVLPVAVLGALALTSEYGSGLIRTTFIAVPRRRSVLAAKATVTGAAALVASELLAFGCFFLTQAILAGHHRGLALSRPGAPAAVLAAGLVLAACALMGVGLGAVIRHAAGAIAAAVGLIYLLGALCLALPGPWSSRLGRFTMPFRRLPARQPASRRAAALPRPVPGGRPGLARLPRCWPPRS